MGIGILEGDSLDAPCNVHERVEACRFTRAMTSKKIAENKNLEVFPARFRRKMPQIRFRARIADRPHFCCFAIAIDVGLIFPPTGTTIEVEAFGC